MSSTKKSAAKKGNEQTNRQPKVAPNKDGRNKAGQTGKTRANFAARQLAAKAELRELILQTARRMALENGFAALSIRKLADKIGYAPGTIYLYFADRDQLVREILVRGFAELSEKLEAAAQAVDAEERLAALLLAYAEFAFANPETYRLSFLDNPAFAEEMLRRAPVEAETGAGRRAFARIVETLGELKSAGRLDAAKDAELLAELLWTAVHGIVSLKLVYPAFPVNPPEVLINTLLASVLTKTTPVA